MIEGRTGLYESETSDVIKWCRRFQDNLISAEGKDERYTDGVKAMQACIKALEMQIPKKPKVTTYGLDKTPVALMFCPVCDRGVSGSYEYCPRCGQKLDWSRD